MASSSSSLAFGCLFMVLACSCMGLGSATVYKVGDAVGWTVGKIDYGTWVSKKTFHVGDTLLFSYNNSYHNVAVVSSQSDFDGCQVKPVTTYATGNDSIVLKAPGDHFYLCGFPGHCLAGQKLKVTALPSKSSSSSAAPSPSPSHSPATPSAPAAAPTGSGGSATASPSEAPPSAGSAPSAGPASAPNSSNAAVVCKGLGLVVSVIVWSMVM